MIREPSQDNGKTGNGEASTPRTEFKVIAGAGGLKASKIGKSFKNRPVVRGVDLEVRRGEVVGLLGPNGAGKTTCFISLPGLIPVDTGNIEIDGHDVTRLPMYRRARMGIGYLPQEALFSAE